MIVVKNISKISIIENLNYTNYQNFLIFFKLLGH